MSPAGVPSLGPRAGIGAHPLGSRGSRRARTTLFRQRFDAEVAVVDDALRIVGLQGDAPLAQAAGAFYIVRFGVVDGRLAVNLVHQAIAAGEGSTFVAGGTESMSRAPFAMLKPETAYPRGVPEMADTVLGYLSGVTGAAWMLAVAGLFVLKSLVTAGLCLAFGLPRAVNARLPEGIARHTQGFGQERRVREQFTERGNIGADQRLARVDRFDGVP